MYIMYPEKMQFNIIDEDEEELIGYAERYICNGDNDMDNEYRVIETSERENLRALLNSIDEEYASEIVKNN